MLIFEALCKHSPAKIPPFILKARKIQIVPSDTRTNTFVHKDAQIDPLRIVPYFGEI